MGDVSAMTVTGGSYPLAGAAAHLVVAFQFLGAILAVDAGPLQERIEFKPIL
jgi:hypothetical protein